MNVTTDKSRTKTGRTREQDMAMSVFADNGGQLAPTQVLTLHAVFNTDTVALLAAMVEYQPSLLETHYLIIKPGMTGPTIFFTPITKGKLKVTPE